MLDINNSVTHKTRWVTKATAKWRVHLITHPLQNVQPYSIVVMGGGEVHPAKG